MSKYIYIVFRKKVWLFSDAGVLLLFTGDAISGQNQHLPTSIPPTAEGIQYY